MGCQASAHKRAGRPSFPYDHVDSEENASEDTPTKPSKHGYGDHNNHNQTDGHDAHHRSKIAFDLHALVSRGSPLSSPGENSPRTSERSSAWELTEEEEADMEARQRALEQRRAERARRAEEEERKELERLAAMRPKLRKPSARPHKTLKARLLEALSHVEGLCGCVQGPLGADHNLLLAWSETLLRRLGGSRTLKALQGKWTFYEIPGEVVAEIVGTEIRWDCGDKTVIELHDGRNFSTVFRGETLHANIDILDNVRWDFGGHWSKMSADDEAMGRFTRQRSVSSLPQMCGDGAMKLYTSIDCLMPFMEDGDIVLLKSSYVLELYKSSEILPRRQRLPEHAVCDVDELKRAAEIGELQVVAISYCWITKEHPDPFGEQLQILGPVIEHFPLKEQLVFFIDWCSLYQEPRSAEQCRSVERALQSMHYWYAHQKVGTWMLTDLPGSVESDHSYEQRGWPSFEKRLGMMLKRQGALLDLGGLCDDMFDADFFHPKQGIMGRCAAHRRPPISPARFNEEIAHKSFSHAKDSQILMERYAEAFRDIVASIEVLNYAGWGFEGEDLKVLSEDFLPLCRRLRTLNLKGNPIGDAGVKALAAVLPLCSTLRQLVLGGAEIGDTGVMAITDALPACESLQALELRNSSAGNAAIGQLYRAWRKCGKSEGRLDIW